MVSFLLIFCIQTVLVHASAVKTDLKVRDGKELLKAVTFLNKRGGNGTIFLHDGMYDVRQRLVFKAPDISLRSISGDREAVVLRGKGMKNSNNAEILIDVQAPNISIFGVTLEQSSHHLIQVKGDKGANNFRLSNCVLKDSYQQLLKVGRGRKSDSPGFSERGVIENCLFEYTAGIGPQFYIGGIDAHGARNWVVRRNIFRNIASPGPSVAEHAIHFWDQSQDNLVEFNVIENCDRGIGFGMGREPKNVNRGGVIQNNIILHNQREHRFADVGIALENSPNTIVKNNVVLLQGDYRNAIEYRFSGTRDVVIENNVVNKAMKSRNNGSAKLVNNVAVDHLPEYFSKLFGAGLGAFEMLCRNTLPESNPAYKGIFAHAPFTCRSHLESE